LFAAKRLDLFLLQRAQQLCLDGEWNVGDLIQEKGSTPGKPKLPFLALMRPGECALFVAEELSGIAPQSTATNGWSHRALS
jgi:hypothetical protein